MISVYIEGEIDLDLLRAGKNIVKSKLIHVDGIASYAAMSLKLNSEWLGFTLN